MDKSRPEVAHAVSPEALADLEMLARDHGMNAELIQSLQAGKEEARAHLKFFKTMMYASNGVVMFLGLALVGFGLQRLIGGFSVLDAICLAIGAVLFLKFSVVFLSMLRALRATEAVARKHELI